MSSFSVATSSFDSLPNKTNNDFNNIDNNNSNFTNTNINSNINNNANIINKTDVNNNENNTNSYLESSVDPDSELVGDIAYDQDDLPIPQGIVSINENQLNQDESIDLNLDNANNQIWLVRLTPQLADLWKSEDFLNGQLLGNIKIPKNSINDPINNNKNNNTNINTNTNNSNNNNNNNNIKSIKSNRDNKILLELNTDLPEHKSLDKEYELKLIKQVVENEYAFSESQFEQFRQRLMYRTQVVSLPNQPRMKTLNKEALTHEANWSRKIRNYKKEAQYREMKARDPNYKTKRSESGMGTTYLSDDEDNQIKRRGRKSAKFEKFEKFRKFIPYAKTIPKKTEIVGKIVHECQVIPIQLVADNKLRMLEQKKRLNQMVKRKTINYLKSERVGLMHGRATPNIQTGSTITLSKELAMKKEAAKQDGRAARIERDVLMNLLFKLFNEYEYWTMKGLREKTNQPEAYLKECLESIALMERKGPYALKWRLKDEYRKSIDVENKVKRGSIEEDNDEVEGKNKDEDNEDEDDYDMDDIEMEDIAAL
jgi:transcription initiation factor TFIIF subunit beta